LRGAIRASCQEASVSAWQSRGHCYSALDLSAQAEILNLLNRLKRSHDMTLILVSHDRGVIAHLCDRAAVMQGGRIEKILHRSELSQV